MWGDKGLRQVNVHSYEDALIAVYSDAYVAFAHGHFDNVMQFSYFDVVGFKGDGWDRLMYAHFQNGETHMINRKVMFGEIRNAGLKQDIDKYLQRYGGAQGICVGGCSR
jgi:hypothetical protein